MVFSRPSAARLSASRARLHFVHCRGASRRFASFSHLVVAAADSSICEQFDRRLVLLDEPVHADNHLSPGFDGVLIFVAGVGDLGLREAAFDGRDHPAHFVDPPDIILRAPLPYRASGARGNNCRPDGSGTSVTPLS